MKVVEQTTLFEGTLMPTGVLTSNETQWKFFSKMAGYMLTDDLVGKGILNADDQAKLNRKIADFSLIDSFPGSPEQVIKELLENTGHESIQQPEAVGYTM
jgi:hypothetical protein